MQWILQEFEDTRKLAKTLDIMNISYTWHKVIPFVGDLIPEPEIPDVDKVILFGSYTLWRYANARNLFPGVFRIEPFVHEKAWHPYLLNGADAWFMSVREIEENLKSSEKLWFLRPVSDSKEEPGKIRSASEIRNLARKVLSLSKEEIPNGSLRHDTKLMLSEPVHILKEWRIWIVRGKVVTYSLYKENEKVIYRYEIDEDALEFAERMASLNTDYAIAYVMDICRTEEGLNLLETNCINAAGFYAADLQNLVSAIEGLNS
jgi:hypothetical protein